MVTNDLDQDALIHEIGETIVDSPRIAAIDWEHLVFVVNIEADHSTMTGFAYQRDGRSRPVTPGGTRILPQLTALRDAMRAAGRGQWVTCLIRLARDDGSIAFHFEYQDPSRWAVTPTNVREMADRLRPGA